MNSVTERRVDLSERIDRGRLGAYALGVTAICAAIIMIEGVDVQMMAFVAPRLAADLGLQMASLGTVFGSGLVGLGIGMIVLGPLADRVGRRPTLIFAFALAGVFTILTAGVTALWQLYVCRIVSGIGIGATVPIVLSLISEIVPRRLRATLLTALSCAAPFGAAVGGLLVGAVIDEAGWRLLFMIAGALSLIILACALPFVPESPAFMARRDARSVKVARLLQRLDRTYDAQAGDEFVLHEPNIDKATLLKLFTAGRAFGTGMLWVIFFSNLLLLHFIKNWLPTIFSGAGLPLQTAITGASLFNAGGIVGGLGLAYLVDRYGAYRMLTVAFVGSAIAAVALGSVVGGSASSILAFAFVSGAFLYGCQYCINALAAAYYPAAMRSTGLGWALGSGRIGAIAGASLGGVLLATGWPMSQIFAGAAAAALVAAACIAILGFTTRARTAAATA